jgi:ATP-dependent exoDNAse (exonuclease V) alpha subunit
MNQSLTLTEEQESLLRHPLPYMMLQRNLLYTAITRARELVVLVGTRKATSMAIRNNRVTRRYTSLARRIQDRLNQTMDTEYAEPQTLNLFHNIL